MSGSEIEQDVRATIAALNKRNLGLIWGFVIWLVGAGVWAGGAYQKFQSMDAHLDKIDQKLDMLSQIEVVRQRQDDTVKRVESLERELIELEHR